MRNKEAWYEDYRNVKGLAKYLMREGCIQTAQELFDYFESPWKWSSEWQEMQSKNWRSN